MVASRFVFALTAVALASAGVAVAQTTSSEEVVATSRAAQLPTQAEQNKAQAAAKARAENTPKPATTQAQLAAQLANASKIERIDPSVSEASTQTVDDIAGKRQIHGSAGVSIGTGGYRSGYVTSIIPLGDNGTLGIAYSQTDYGKNGGLGYGYDDYGYDGYDGYGMGGYGYGGYGYRWGRRGGTSQSLGLSLDLSHSQNASDTPDGCAPGFRDGDHYVQPLWVTRMRGGCTTADQP